MFALLLLMKLASLPRARVIIRLVCVHYCLSRPGLCLSSVGDMKASGRRSRQEINIINPGLYDYTYQSLLLYRGNRINPRSIIHHDFIPSLLLLIGLCCG